MLYYIIHLYLIILIVYYLISINISKYLIMYTKISCRKNHYFKMKIYRKEKGVKYLLNPIEFETQFKDIIFRADGYFL